LQPGATFSSYAHPDRRDLGATKEVAFGQDADQLFGLIDNRQSADAVFAHCVDRINQGSIDADRNHISPES
jgi:hypothetical protein